MTTKWIRHIAWRLAAGLGVLWATATLTFLAMHATSGDTALAILGGPDALPSPAVLAAVRQEYHLDQPLHTQYFFYVAKLASCDLGESYRLRVPVIDAIARQMPSTLQLALCAALVAVVLSVTVALATARRAEWLRSLFSGYELVVCSMPSFVIGLLLLMVFSFYFYLVPASGSHGWKSLVLPVVTLSLPIAAVLSQVLRESLEDILEQSFILTARTRGMSETGVRLRHALRHILIPLVTLSGFIFSGLLGGAAIVESLFARQGLGRLMVDAATAKDVPVVLGMTLFVALVYVVINLLVDLAYTFIDPRIKTETL